MCGSLAANWHCQSPGCHFKTLITAGGFLLALVGAGATALKAPIEADTVRDRAEIQELKRTTMGRDESLVRFQMMEREIARGDAAWGGPRERPPAEAINGEAHPTPPPLSDLRATILRRCSGGVRGRTQERPRASANRPRPRPLIPGRGA